MDKYIVKHTYLNYDDNKRAEIFKKKILKIINTMDKDSLCRNLHKEKQL